MGGFGFKRTSLKEEEFKYFFQRKILTRPEVKSTSQLKPIVEWVTKRGGKPVKTTHFGKRDNSFELIEIDFNGTPEEYFKEISWEEWYEVFNKNKLRFIYIEKNSNGKESKFYKLCQ